MMRQWIAAGLFIASSSVLASGLEIGLSSDTAQFNFNTDSSAIGYGGANASLGAFYNESDDFAFSAGLDVENPPAGAPKPYSFGVGARALFMGIDKGEDNSDYAQGVAIGFQGTYHFPGNVPLALSAQLYYAPPITTFGDADDLTDANVRVSAEVVPDAKAFVGYRYLAAEPKGRDGNAAELDNSLQVGVRIEF